MHSLLNLCAFEFGRFAVEDIDWLEPPFQKVYCSVEDSAQVTGDSSLCVAERSSVGLSDDGEELVECVVCVYGESFVFKLGIVDGFGFDKVAEV